MPPPSLALGRGKPATRGCGPLALFMRTGRLSKETAAKRGATVGGNEGGNEGDHLFIIPGFPDSKAPLNGTLQGAVT